MTCQIFEKEFTLISDHQMLSNEAKVHMATCTDCRTLYGSLKGFHEAVATEKREKVNPFLATRVMETLEESKLTCGIFVFRKSLQAAAVVVALLVGVWCAMLFDVGPHDPDLILSEYFFQSNSGLEIENIWLNIDLYEE